MAVTVGHATAATGVDSGDGKISKNAWNENHTITGLGTMAEATAADYSTTAQANALYTPKSRGPARLAGNWYFPESYTGTLAAGIAMASGIIYYCPFVLERAITVSDLGARITTLAASGNIKLAIYANDASTNRPTGTPIAETASISTASAVNVSADITGSNVALAADTLYWAAFWADGTAAGTVILQTNTTASVSGFSRFVGGAQDEISSGATGGVSYVQSSEAYGTWPDAASESLTVTSNANRYYAMQLKAA